MSDELRDGRPDNPYYNAQLGAVTTSDGEAFAIMTTTAPGDPYPNDGQEIFPYFDNQLAAVTVQLEDGSYAIRTTGGSGPGTTPTLSQVLTEGNTGPDGTGIELVNAGITTENIIINNGTAFATLNSDATTDRTIAFPDADGTIALQEGLTLETVLNNGNIGPSGVNIILPGAALQAQSIRIVTGGDEGTITTISGTSTADRNIVLPDADGTIALFGDIPPAPGLPQVLSVDATAGDVTLTILHSGDDAKSYVAPTEVASIAADGTSGVALQAGQYFTFSDGTNTLSLAGQIFSGGNIVTMGSEGWQFPTIGGTGYTNDGTYPVSYRWLNGVVFFKGRFNAATVNSGTLFTLPAAYRPSQLTSLMGAAINGGPALAFRFIIDTSGNVTVNFYTANPTGTPPGAICILDGRSFAL